MESVSVARAHRLAAQGRLDLIKKTLATPGARSSLVRLILQAVAAQYAGDMLRCVGSFEKALRISSDVERAYVVDLLGPILLSQGRVEEAREAIASVMFIPPGFVALFDSMKWVVAAMAGLNIGTQLSTDLEPCDELHRGRALQRVAAAAFYSKSYDLAIESAKASVRIFERVGALRSTAASLSVMYNIHHAVTGDIEEAYRTAQQLTASARKARDASFGSGGLVAQYEIAAEFGDASTVAKLKAEINRISMPTQYRETFARGLADALPYGWSGDFGVLHIHAGLMRDAPEASRPALAFASALCSLADAALSDVPAARRSSRYALTLATHARPGEPAFDTRYRRLARALAAATCILIGDSVRGSRAIKLKTLQHNDVLDIVAAADGGDWRSANRRVRGYARVVAAAYSKIHREASPVLTPTELHILQMLAEGKSAEQVAIETRRSVHTVRAHTRNIIDKFAVSGRLAAINLARRAGMIS